FAIGMTLDNTIVVLESIERERRKGLGRIEASVAGLKQVWTAVLASTLTTVLVFAPVFRYCHCHLRINNCVHAGRSHCCAHCQQSLIFWVKKYQAWLRVLDKRT